MSHRNIKNTLIYIDLEVALFSRKAMNSMLRSSKTVEEACKLARWALGFHYHRWRPDLPQAKMKKLYNTSKSRDAFKVGFLTIKSLLIAIIVSVFSILAVIYVLALRFMFQTVTLNTLDWIMASSLPPEVLCNSRGFHEEKNFDELEWATTTI